ncbi:hypothetical protein PHMEG_00029283, partial [Phytophthora megakarya]
DAPEQASVGGAVKVESPAMDGTSEKSQLGHDVIEVDALEEMSVSLSSYVQVPSEVVASRMQIPSFAQETVDLTAVDDAEASEVPVAPNLVKLYVDDQVRRWEQVSLEFVMPPVIEYAWPHPAPSFQTWYGTVMATSEYLASQMSSGARAQTWISEWRLVRLAPNMSADLTSVTVPLNELSMRECAAVLQTMFFEVGFKFRNLVPEWFRVSAPKAEVDVMRRVAEELQHLLTVELLEWQQVTSGAQCRVVSPLDARDLNGHSEEMRPEDAEGDSLMSSYEAELLGRASQFALNAMRSTQDMLARMESKQDTTQAQLNQRVDQAFQAIQMLAARPGVFQSAIIPNAGMPTVPVHMSTGAAEAALSETTSHDVARALKAAETQFEERWQRREAEAEKAKESWATNLQESLNDQWVSVMSAQMQRLQEEITSLKAQSGSEG